jgi:ADP-ribosylglycohydrolase
MPSFSADAILGCLIGGAMGDAIGAAAEGRRVPPPFADLARGPWSITDDTQLTLATCEAITTAQTVDPESIAASMLRWYRRGRLTGLGSSTLKALRDLDAGIHWALSGQQGNRAAGNGAAMRIAPLAFMLDATLPSSRRTIRDVCRITHHSDEAYAGALAVILEIQGSATGATAGHEHPRSDSGVRESCGHDNYCRGRHAVR